MSSAPPALPARYLFREPLGQGPRALVYRVFDTALGRDVAMKVARAALSPEELRHFTAQAHTCAQLHHPHIVAVFDQGTLPNHTPYYTMRLVRGVSLRATIAQHLNRDLSLLPLLVHVHAAASALSYAHPQGITHGALNSQRILVDHTGSTMVLGWGATAATDPSRDLQALRAVLYEVLTGQAPAAPAAPPQELTEEALPVALCALAAPPPAEGLPTAAEAFSIIDAWWRREQQQQQLAAFVRQADSLANKARQLRAQAENHARQAQMALEGVAPWAPEQQKRPGWALEDSAEAKRREADIQDLLHEQTLEAALRLNPDDPSARQRLAAHHRALHQAQEDQLRFTAAAHQELLLRTFDDGDHADYLAGVSSLSLYTDPPQARVTLYQVVERDRLSQPLRLRSLGLTPLLGLPLRHGNYLLRIEAPGHDTVRLPILLRRGQTCERTGPGEHTPRVLRLPKEGELPPHSVLVPAGWFYCGHAAPVRRWADDFVIQRFPVTNAEYLLFLNSLVHSGRLQEAAEATPNAPGHGSGYHLQGGRYVLGRDNEGDLWLPDMPVLRVSWQQANAYAAWYADDTNQPWRLPHELEWEKAARGVDWRPLPWGQHFDPSACRMFTSQEGPPHPTPVDSYPLDESPYGVRGMMGNVQDWCLLPHHKEPSLRGDRLAYQAPAAETYGTRGAAFPYPAHTMNLGLRWRVAPTEANDLISFRLARSY